MCCREHPSPHIVLAGGGTGGHVFPGVALVEALRGKRPNVLVTWLGVGKPLERRMTERLGVEYVAIDAPRSPLAPFRMLGAVRRAARIMREQETRVVVGLGGYVALPACLAARWRRVPLVLLEQNVMPGRVTRLASRWADDVCMARDESRRFLPRRAGAITTGTPVRRAFHDAIGERTDSTLRLVVLGGSGGASAINEAVPHALREVISHANDEASRWSVLHISGEKDVDATRAAYEGLSCETRVEAFIHDMASVLTGAELVVCRAGGSTLAELAVLGVPAIVVPYPHAKDDHQSANAAVYVSQGAALLASQTWAREGQAATFPERLTAALRELLFDAPRRRAMSEAMRRLATPDASDRIADIVLARALHIHELP